LIAEYAVLYSAGDWCLVEQPVPYKRYKLGVITHVVMDRGGWVKSVALHECGLQDPIAYSHYTSNVQLEITAMNEISGAREDVILQAQRYHGENPAMAHCAKWSFVDIYTDTGRVPFSWLSPVMIKIDYEMYTRRMKYTPLRLRRIVAAGSRERMVAMLQTTEKMFKDIKHAVPSSPHAYHRTPM
jgi:hypothetical protein